MYRERLYIATGFGLIQCVKGLMSFEDVVRSPESLDHCGINILIQDLLAALGHAKHGNAIAQQHRKRAAALTTRLAGLVIGSLNTSGVGWIRSMTDVERHAELVYAETLFEKVCLHDSALLSPLTFLGYGWDCIFGRLVGVH